MLSVVCGPAPTIRYGYHDAQTGNITVGSVITYTCQPQHFFPDRSTEKKTICLDSGLYDEHIPDCLGKKIPPDAI